MDGLFAPFSSLLACDFLIPSKPANSVTQPTSSVVAKVIFVHGFSEHINRYNDFFPKLAEHGIEVFAWDQRGWGRSVTKPAEKGLTGPTSRVVADVAAFIQDKLPSDVPVFVMGHSMGGGEILTLAGDAQYKQLVGQIRGWVSHSCIAEAHFRHAGHRIRRTQK